jgi:DNA (cytosine-5)-methyltransferase 1
MKKPIAIDLFSGCGGLTEGLTQAGFRVIAGAEIRSEARAAYKANHPTVSLFEDVRAVSLSSIQERQKIERGQLDLLAACPPCQGFSTLRTKNHTNPARDDRNNLIFEVLRIAGELLPKAILIENVPGLLANWRIDDFRRALHKLGYKTNQGVLDAANFGVPQRRRRMIFIGLLGEVQPPIPEATHSVPVTVRDVLEHLPSWDAPDAPALHRMRQRFSPEVQKRINRIPKDGGSRRHLGSEDQLDCHKRQQGFNDVYGRLSWDKVSGTITRSCHNPSKGRYLHPEENRALTLYEALLLQGFPPDYVLPADGGIEKTASLIGEAFPPPFASAQAKHIRRLLMRSFAEATDR